MLSPEPSTTAAIEVLQSPQFLGKTGIRTIFSLKVSNVFDIRRFSAFPEEDERLLLCATPFKVVGKLDAGNGLTMVQMEQDVDRPPLISGFPGMKTKTAPSSASGGGGGDGGAAAHFHGRG